MVFLMCKVEVVEHPCVWVLKLLPSFSLLGFNHVLHAECEITAVEEASGHFAVDFSELVVVFFALGSDHGEDIFIVGFHLDEVLHLEVHFCPKLLDDDHFFSFVNILGISQGQNILKVG